MSQIFEILSGIGYRLHDRGTEYRAKPIYRDSDNENSLKIDKRTGDWIDFSQSISGKFEELVRMSLNLADVTEVKKFLETKQFTVIQSFGKPAIKQVKVLDDATIENLEPDHSYWEGRGIPTIVISEFSGGVCSSGKMKGRYALPIYDERYKIIGVSGRDITGKSNVKWKHLNSRSGWVFPIHLNKEIIQKSRRVILVESIGCLLALWSVGIKDVLVLFGVDLSLPLLNAILKLEPKQIIISTNNDKNNGFVGNNASIKIRKKLEKYFDSSSVKIQLPESGKDLNEVLLNKKEELERWRTQPLTKRNEEGRI